MKVKGLSNSSLKELYSVMDRRRKSCIQNPKEEEVYETQKDDWQDMFVEIKNEMNDRGLI